QRVLTERDDAAERLVRARRVGRAARERGAARRPAQVRVEVALEAAALGLGRGRRRGRRRRRRRHAAAAAAPRVKELALEAELAAPRARVQRRVEEAARALAAHKLEILPGLGLVQDGAVLRRLVGALVGVA